MFRFCVLCSLATILLACGFPQTLMAQSIFDEELDVVPELKPLDTKLRKQLRVWFDGRDAAYKAAGDKQTAETIRESDRLNPLTVHGESILKYALEHPGTQSSFICLAYILDWGEGRPLAIYREACDELIARHRNNPALTWLCARCVNYLRCDSMGQFLTNLSEVSDNPDVKAAATFHLAELLDNVVQNCGRVADVRDRFEASGFLEARPDVAVSLKSLAKLDVQVVAAELDRLLRLVADEFGDLRAWSCKRTFSRLNYEFHSDESNQTFRERVDRLNYQITNLRIGCMAPDFSGMLISGEQFSLSDRRGKPTLVMFSFDGCGPCKAMYPMIRKAQEQFSDSAFSVIGVMVDDELKSARNATTTGGISWPCVWDGADGPIAKAYAVRGYPTVILLHRDGTIAARPARDEKQLIAHIEKVVKQN
jgi:peroxiredoxin